jgi:hypothetical protein
MTAPTHRLSRSWALGLALVGAFTLNATTAAAQTWNYKSYIRDASTGTYDKTKFRTSTITLKDEKDGKGTFRMIMAAARPDPCISAGDLPAEVQRDAETVTITVVPTLHGCEQFRYVIKTDGSGGVRMHRRSGEWKADGFDHDLTPAK